MNKKTPESQGTAGQSFLPYLKWLLLLLIVVLTAIIRYRLIDVPLERDEGEYAYAGQLILQGIPPYLQIYNMKLPGIYAAYAAMLAVFGQTHTGIHLGLLVINSATTVLVFLLAKCLMRPAAALAAAAVFAVLSAGQALQGIYANSEHFVILFAVGGLLLLVRTIDNNKVIPLFFSGVMLCAGLLMKQHGAAFMAMGLLYIVTASMIKYPAGRRSVTEKCVLFVSGAASLFGLTCLILFLSGTFEKFWFWTVDYALAYVSLFPFELAWKMFTTQASFVSAPAAPLWILAGFGLMSLPWSRLKREHKVFLLLFVICSLLAICPGFYFRHHYFLMTLPAAALLAGILINTIQDMSANSSRLIRYGLPALLVISCLAFPIFQQRDFLFKMTPAQISRAIFPSNPFPESLEIAGIIRANTEENDRIAVIGSEPQIYFYSGRRSASGYIYMYPLMEDHDFALLMQNEMIQEIEASRPAFLVFVGIEKSWLNRKNSHTLLFDWFREYRKKYRLVGLVELFQDRSVYFFEPDIKWPPDSRDWMALFKRKN